MHKPVRADLWVGAEQRAGSGAERDVGGRVVQERRQRAGDPEELARRGQAQPRAALPQQLRAMPSCDVPGRCALMIDACVQTLYTASNTPTLHGSTITWRVVLSHTRGEM